MKHMPTFLIAGLLLTLVGCEEKSKTPARRRDPAREAEIARLRAEMERRIEEARDEHTIRMARMRTIRITAFVLLTGGAVTWFILIHRPAGTWSLLSGISRPTEPTTRPQWQDHLPLARGPGRIIEVPPPSANQAPERVIPESTSAPQLPTNPNPPPQPHLHRRHGRRRRRRRPRQPQAS